MKNLTLFLLFTTAVTIAKAVSTGEIIGRITVKETGQPVAMAEIIFENKMDKVVVVANEHGYYYAHHLPTGKYEVRIQYNERTFFVNKVQVYDGYSAEVNLAVSNNNSLPQRVEISYDEYKLSSISNTNKRLTNSDFNQPTQSLGDMMSTQSGVDVRDGKMYVKGSDQVRFFIDGTPVMGPAVIR